MTEQEQRQAVVDAARTYIGTRYHHNAKLRGVGVDCATMIALAFQDAGARPPIDVGEYSSQWHMHSTDPLYEKAIVAQGGKQVDVPQVGDVALYWQGLQFAHGAIVSCVEPLTIIHAYAQARRTLEGKESDFPGFVDAKKKFFSAW